MACSPMQCANHIRHGAPCLIATLSGSGAHLPCHCFLGPA